MGYMGYPIYGVSLDMGYTAVARIAHMGYPSYCRTSTDSHQPVWLVTICTQLVVIPASYTPVSWCCNIVPRRMHPKPNTVICLYRACVPGGVSHVCAVLGPY